MSKTSSETETEDLILKDVKFQFELIFRSTDFLEQKSSSFIGFVSIFFVILLTIIFSAKVYQFFSQDNIWIFTVFIALILAFLIISIFLSFLIIFGYPQNIGPDLQSLYKHRKINATDFKDGLIREYIRITLKNAKLMQKKILEWQLSVFFSSIVILLVIVFIAVIGLVNINFYPIEGTIVGTIVLLLIISIGIYKITIDYQKEKKELDGRYREWIEKYGD